MVLRPSVESDILNFWLSVLLYTTRAGDRPESDPGEGRGGGYVDCIKIVKLSSQFLLSTLKLSINSFSPPTWAPLLQKVHNRIKIAISSFEH